MLTGSVLFQHGPTPLPVACGKAICIVRNNIEGCTTASKLHKLNRLGVIDNVVYCAIL